MSFSAAVNAPPVSSSVHVYVSPQLISESLRSESRGLHLPKRHPAGQSLEFGHGLRIQPVHFTPSAHAGIPQRR